jgi:hypothetical protein
MREMVSICARSLRNASTAHALCRRAVVETFEPRTLLSTGPQALAGLSDPVVPLDGGVHVNTFTTEFQGEPAVAGDADGDYVVAWSSYKQEGSSNFGVYAQRYAADGTPRGGEFRVDASPTLYNREATVAMDADGDFVVAWEQFNAAGNGANIMARRYGADGVAKGPQFKVNSATGNFHRGPSVAMRDTGEFIVTWRGPGPDQADIYFRRFDANGAALSGDVLANADTTGIQIDPDVAVNSSGAFVITWMRPGPNRTDHIAARMFDPTGRPVGGEFFVTTPQQDNATSPAVGMGEAGDFVIAWGGLGIEGNGIFVRTYKPNGQVKGPAFMALNDAHQTSWGDVAVADDGSFFVVGDTNFIRGRLYNAAGGPQTPELVLSTTDTAGRAAVTLTDRGRIVTAWHGQGPGEVQPEDVEGVYARRFQVNGPLAAGAVVKRGVFYNNSKFDGHDGAANAADDAAIAPDKSPLLSPGQFPTFANVTSFDKGINGVMIDVANLPAGVELTPADFEIAGGSRPVSVTVRRGAGAGGSDRVTLVWPDYRPGVEFAPSALANGWLTVTLRATERTGLAQPDVFSFGNLIGETGDAGDALGFHVNAIDLSTVKRALNSNAPITNATDFNRDGRVNALDLAVVKRNLNRGLPPPAPAAAVPAPMEREQGASRPTLAADGVL